MAQKVPQAEHFHRFASISRVSKAITSDLTPSAKLENPAFVERLQQLYSYLFAVNPNGGIRDIAPVDIWKRTHGNAIVQSVQPLSIGSCILFGLLQACTRSCEIILRFYSSSMMVLRIHGMKYRTGGFCIYFSVQQAEHFSCDAPMLARTGRGKTDL